MFEFTKERGDRKKEKNKVIRKNEKMIKEKGD